MFPNGLVFAAGEEDGGADGGLAASGRLQAGRAVAFPPQPGHHGHRQPCHAQVLALLSSRTTQTLFT